MYNINITEPGILHYPLHAHKKYEIMVYLEGSGYLRTENKNYPFSPGTIIIVPPALKHGSVSDNGFVNISIESDFENIFHNNDIISFSDDEQNEVVILSKLIYNNRFTDKHYLDILCSAFTRRLLVEIDNKSRIQSAIDDIILKISEQYHDSEINLVKILNDSNYAEDYIRSQFKKFTNKTPTFFLNELRIKHASFLISVYGDNISLGEIAEKCGYTDYVYFSKKFKQITGITPAEYKKTISSF